MSTAAEIYDFLHQIAASALSATVISAGIVFLARNYIGERIKGSIQTEYQQKLEAIKAELKYRGDAEIERLKSELSLLSSQRNVVFTHLHQKRAEAIAAIYEPLVEVHLWLKELVSGIEMAGMPTKEELHKKLVTAHDAFSAALRSRKIFLPKKTADMLDEINRAYLSTGNLFVRMVWKAEQTDHRLWMELEEKTSGPTSKALATLEAEFRKILGDAKEPNGAESTK